MAEMLYLSVLLVHIIGAIAQDTAIPEVKYRWRVIDYVFPNDTVRNESLSSGAYIPQNNMPMGIQTWRNKLFVTVPRLKLGVVSTLNFVWMNDTSQSPLLIPYPSWEATRMQTPNGIVNIDRSKVDECNRLWGLDTGIDNVNGNRTVVRPSRLIAIDLTTDQVVRTYQLTEQDIGPNSTIANLEVDTDTSSCDNTYVYLADSATNALIVYHYASNDSWTFRHNFFHFDPLQGNYEIRGSNFQWTDGISGLAMSTRQPDGHRTLYFHPLSSTTEFAVSTRTVRNKTMATAPNYYFFTTLGWKGPSTNGPIVRIDPTTGIAYFPLIIQNAIACWNTGRILSPMTYRVVWRDNFLLNYPNDITLADGRLCALSNRLPVMLFGTYNNNEFNFYVTCRNLVSLTIVCA